MADKTLTWMGWDGMGWDGMGGMGRGRDMVQAFAAV